MSEFQPISFPEWKSVLARADLSAAVRASHAREIVTFLHHCKNVRSPATVEVIKEWLNRRETAADGPAHRALRWFYREGSRTRPGASADLPANDLPPAIRRPRLALRPMEPVPAAKDMGGPDWEITLIQTIRVRGLLWRTEETYRMWARRFAAFIAPRTPLVATAEEVGAFLTDLAVRNRASPSSQRQALNALVFVTRRPEMRAPRLITLRSASGQPLTQTAG